jgi:hypothetical protein
VVAKHHLEKKRRTFSNIEGKASARQDQSNLDSKAFVGGGANTLSVAKHPLEKRPK